MTKPEGMFTVKSKALSGALLRLVKIIGINPIVSILENILFQVKGTHLTLTSSDLQTTIITTIEVSRPAFDDKEEFDFCIMGKQLHAIIAMLGDVNVSFTKFDVPNKVHIVDEKNRKYIFETDNAADFPKFPNVSVNAETEVRFETLKDTLTHMVRHTSNDEIRPAMTGIMMNISPDQITFAATDGHTLAVNKIITPSRIQDPTQYVVPKTLIRLILAVGPKKSGASIKFGFSESNCFVTIDESTRLIGRRIDTPFPEYNKAIPYFSSENPSYKFEVDRKTILEAAKRVGLFCKSYTKEVLLNWNPVYPTFLRFTAHNLDYGYEADEMIDFEYKDDPSRKNEKWRIGFNIYYFLRCIQNLKGKTITIQNYTARTAILITTENPTDGLCLLMPIMLENL